MLAKTPRRHRARASYEDPHFACFLDAACLFFAAVAIYSLLRKYCKNRRESACGVISPGRSSIPEPGPEGSNLYWPGMTGPLSTLINLMYWRRLLSCRSHEGELVLTWTRLLWTMIPLLVGSTTMPWPVASTTRKCNGSNQ